MLYHIMPHFNWFGRGRPLQIAIMVTCQTIKVSSLGLLETQIGWKPSAIPEVDLRGAFSGCILAFLGGEKAGRRMSMWIAMVFIIVGAILQTTSYGVPQILVARYITGIGTGIETSTVPMYQSELVEAHKRGRVVSSEPLFVGVGIVIAYFFDYGIAYAGGPIAWRLPIACQIIFAIVVIVMVFGVPESPRYLYKEGRNEEALQVLCDVYDGTPEDEKIAREQKGILDALAMERAHGEYKWSQIFKQDEVQTGRRVLLAYGMQFMNQIGGINLVVYYVPTALERNVGLTHNLSLLIGGFVQCCFFIGSLVPTFFLDKMGRRRPMMWGSLGLAISMMLIAVLLSFTPERGYSDSVKTATSSAAVTFFFTYNFVVVMITPTLLNNLQWQAYLIFMCTNLAFIPLVYFCYPETSNLTLEEVDFLFIKDGSKGIHKFTGPSQPVRISLSGDVEQGARRMMHGEKGEKRGSEGGAAFVEDVDKVEK
ncbi:putative Myo-inositol transporter 1 [Aureobasidium pullulans]|uniref:Putative Myo-inositol transporter 1 n=1 Tax=Aureobasidium pullulans TaxID=5580 RepID=A0A4S9KJT2_AURPU|nr:putative Myo-inositol transporter 1 [Aureobasidium pullulans]